jgi:putative restriction endonuclease
LAKGVFDTKSGSGYDDDITRRYHFPTSSNYLQAARAVVGDWIVYREPQRNRGRRAYVAAAHVARIEPDTNKARHAYAIIDDFVPFDPLVSFAGPDGYWEESLRLVEDPNRVGASLQNKSVRLISDADFSRIVTAGIAETLAPENAIRLGLGFEEPAALAFQFPDDPVENVRRVEQLLINKKIRDANFRRMVCDAYEDRCAITGLRIVNGGGRSEVQAAHIWGVGEGGPDVVQNGIALSGTVHWLFDRHLISLTDDYKLLVSHNKVPSELRPLFEKQMDGIHLPKDRRLWPHPKYVQRHREAFASY